ncbi:YkgJ family cysteine cluster protein [Desulfurococcaceae archaeon MEX13E-LK6-19]|nr:YkgJ family cysteine cluster protein [Desulfurococcaceae archaeon MEX13E-LK6-19]
MTTERFRCLRKGYCCKLSPISLLPFEEYLLKVAAEKLDIKCVITHGYTVFDRRTRSHIALSYVLELNNGKCPFLDSDNKCLLHNSYKPLVCRAFPYIPREVRYLYNTDMRIIIAYTEYGLSRKCPVIEASINYISRFMNVNPMYLSMYMPSEVKAAMEMERKRGIIMRLLSNLWKKGLVDLEPGEKNPTNKDNVVNVYDILRAYYPDLPYILGVHEAIASLKVLTSRRR